MQQRLGDLHFAKIFLYTVDFNEISELQKQGDWNTATTKLRNHAKIIENSGAEILLLCANTMHKVVSKIERLLSPFCT